MSQPMERPATAATSSEEPLEPGQLISSRRYHCLMETMVVCLHANRCFSKRGEHELPSREHVSTLVYEYEQRAPPKLGVGDDSEVLATLIREHLDRLDASSAAAAAPSSSAAAFHRDDISVITSNTFRTSDTMQSAPIGFRDGDSTTAALSRGCSKASRAPSVEDEGVAVVVLLLRSYNIPDPRPEDDEIKSALDRVNGNSDHAAQLLAAQILWSRLNSDSVTLSRCCDVLSMHDFHYPRALASLEEQSASDDSSSASASGSTSASSEELNTSLQEPNTSLQEVFSELLISADSSQSSRASSSKPATPNTTKSARKTPGRKTSRTSTMLSIDEEVPEHTHGRSSARKPSPATPSATPSRKSSAKKKTPGTSKRDNRSRTTQQRQAGSSSRAVEDRCDVSTAGGRAYDFKKGIKRLTEFQKITPTDQYDKSHIESFCDNTATMFAYFIVHSDKEPKNTTSKDQVPDSEAEAVARVLQQCEYKSLHKKNPTRHKIVDDHKNFGDFLQRYKKEGSRHRKEFKEFLREFGFLGGK